MQSVSACIGQIMGSIYTDVMQPIHRRYLDLEPEGLKQR
jgi:hypothetical protein